MYQSVQALPSPRGVITIGILMTIACVTTACQSSEAPVAHPSPPPPATRHIVFDMQLRSGGLRNIYRIALDGSGLVRLTSDSTEHHGPSAHDSLVIFGSARRNGAMIASVEGDAGSSTPTLFGPGDAPAISPDGTMVAYLSFAGPVPRVWIARVDGTQAHRLVAAQGGWDGAVEAHPAWSPGGDRIAYVSSRGSGAAIFIATVSAGAGSATMLTGSTPGASVEPAWSADGRQLVFTSNRDGPTDLYLVTVATGSVSRLTNVGNAGQPTWLPDGHIVFTQWVGGAAGLAWLDPTNPSHISAIITGGDAQRAASSQ